MSRCLLGTILDIYFLIFQILILLVHLQSWISEHFQNILHSFFWTISYAFEGERTRTCSAYFVRFGFSCSLKWTWSVPSPSLLAVLFPKHYIHESRKYYSAIYGRLDSEILKSKMLLSNYSYQLLIRWLTQWTPSFSLKPVFFWRFRNQNWASNKSHRLESIISRIFKFAFLGWKA